MTPLAYLVKDNRAFEREATEDNLTDFEIAERKALPRHKQEHRLLGTVLAKQLLSETYTKECGVRIPPHSIEVYRLPSGQPTYRFYDGVADLPIYPISISHCTEATGVALARSFEFGIGIDVETIRTFKPSTIEAFLSLREREWIATHPQDVRSGFTTLLWSIKESYLKARGVGLTIHPNKVEICYNTSTHSFELQGSALSQGLLGAVCHAKVKHGTVESIVIVSNHAPNH